MIKTRVGNGYCSRHQAQGAYSYTNICETCENCASGPEFAAALTDQLHDIRALQAEFPNLPIIAISGGGRMGNLNYLEMARTFGVSGTTPKPFPPDEILARVDTALKH